MITKLAPAAVCVIDDDKTEYRAILDALFHLGVASVHIRGKSEDHLPVEPLKGLRVIFVDLHLSGHVGKAAAAHTAHIFTRVVAPETTPALVVIWSKHADDKEGLPDDDEPTVEELFKQYLLEAVPEYKTRLIFTRMAKHRTPPEEWVSGLTNQIQEICGQYEGFDILWSWEALVRDAGIEVSKELTRIASQEAADSIESRNSALKLLLKSLAHEQGGPSCVPATAQRHLATVLAQTLADNLEHCNAVDDLSRHGTWLCERDNTPSPSMRSEINALLLTAAPANLPAVFVPGTVFRLTNSQYFHQLFGVSVDELTKRAYQGPPTKFEDWKKSCVPQPIIIEISPACDVQQKERRNALLIGGLILPAKADPKKIESRDSFLQLPIFSLRWPCSRFPKQDAFLVFCCRYKATLPCDEEPRWLIPWFRLRELPTASIRNWHSSHAARVGYVSL